MPNTEALVDTFEYILTHPKEWDQSSWRCGTTYCFAGNAAVNIFGVVLDRNNDIVLTPESAELLNNTEVNDFMRAFYGLAHRSWQEGDLLHVGDFAEVALGLTVEQADELFHGENTLFDLRQIIEQITGIRLPVLVET